MLAAAVTFRATQHQSFSEAAEDMSRGAPFVGAAIVLGLVLFVLGLRALVTRRDLEVPVAAVLAGAVLPWAVGLAVSAWVWTHIERDVIPNADASSVRAMAVRGLGETLRATTVGARVACALQLAAAVVLAALARARRGSDDAAADEAHAGAVAAVLGAVLAAGCMAWSEVEAYALVAFTNADRDSRAHLAEAAISSELAVLFGTAVALVAPVVLVVRLARALVARPTAEVPLARVGAAFAVALVLLAADRGVAWHLHGRAAALVRPPWWAVPGFLPVPIDDDVLESGWDVRPPEILADAHGLAAADGARLSRDVAVARWRAARDARERLEAHDHGGFPRRPEPSVSGCPVDLSFEPGASVAIDRRTPARVLREIASGAREAGEATLTIVGEASRAHLAPRPAFVLPLARSYVEHNPFSLGLALAPARCVPSVPGELVLAVTVGASSPPRVEVFATGRAVDLDDPEPLDELHAQVPNAGMLVLLAIADDATAETLVHAVEALARMPFRNDGWLLLPGAVPRPPPLEWRVTLDVPGDALVPSEARAFFAERTPAVAACAAASAAGAFMPVVELRLDVHEARPRRPAWDDSVEPCVREALTGADAVAATAGGSLTVTYTTSSE